MGLVPTWVVVGVLAAVAQSTYATLQNRLTADVDALRLSYVTAVLGTCLLAPVAAWTISGQSVTVTLPVVSGLVVSAAANVGALYAYLTALDRTDLSVVAPLRQSTPVFVAALEPVLLGTRFDPRVALAAVVVVGGGYVVLAEDVALLGPIRRATRAGPLLALSTALLFAVASVASRFVVVRVPPLAYTAALYAAMAAAYFLLTRHRATTPSPRELLDGRFLALGVATSVRSLLVFVTFSLVAAAQATVVLRLSVLLNVLAGGVLFAEGGLARRLVGGFLVVAGVALAV